MKKSELSFLFFFVGESKGAKRARVQKKKKRTVEKENIFSPPLFSFCVRPDSKSHFLLHLHSRASVPLQPSGSFLFLFFRKLEPSLWTAFQ